MKKWKYGVLEKMINEWEERNRQANKQTEKEIDRGRNGK